MNLKLSIVNYQLSIFVALITFFALPVKAQVTIGAQKAPHSYSVLELMSTKGGLRLPMLSNDDRDALKLTSDSTEANGLFIYNTDIDCVEFWSGGKWIDLCNNTAPAFTANNSITLTSGTNIQTVCGGAAITPITYATTGATGATFIGLPAGVTGSWNAGIVTISGIPTTSGNYIVVLTGGSGSGMAVGTITVNQVLSAISGANGVTKGATDLIYSVTPVSGVTDYTWTVPAGWSIISGLGTASITVDAGTTDGPAGAITVRANNGNCTGTSTLAVSVGCPVKTVGGSWLTFMCYNLGAAEAVKSLTPAQQTNYSTPADEYGDYYQWGRVADGHQLSNSGTVLGPITTFDSKGQAVGDTIGKFIINNNGTWRLPIPQKDNLWSNEGKSVADPCPAGWRIPTITELQSILNGSSSTISSIPAAGTICTSGNKWVWSNTTTQGWLITPTGSSAPTLFLPLARYRDCHNGVVNTNMFGYYWSSSANGLNANVNTFTFAPTFLLAGDIIATANGLSIRCVSE